MSPVRSRARSENAGIRHGAARLEMIGDALADDGKHGQAGREDTGRWQRPNPRIGVDEDGGVEVFQPAEQRESLVVIGRGAVAAAGGRNPLEIVDRHRAGRGVADRANRQTREVLRFVGQHPPREVRRLGAEAPRPPTIGSMNRKRAEAGAHAPGSHGL